MKTAHVIFFCVKNRWPNDQKQLALQKVQEQVHSIDRKIQSTRAAREQALAHMDQ